jgi:hypothetical protein
MKRSYLTDLSDAEWGYLEPHVPAPNVRGRPRIHTTREVLDAVFYVLKSGRPWRLLPRDFPPSRGDAPLLDDGGPVAVDEDAVIVVLGEGYFCGSHLPWAQAAPVIVRGAQAPAFSPDRRPSCRLVPFEALRTTLGPEKHPLPKIRHLGDAPPLCSR